MKAKLTKYSVALALVGTLFLPTGQAEAEILDSKVSMV